MADTYGNPNVERTGNVIIVNLVITHKSSRRRESGLLDDFALQILRFAQNDSQGFCHSERSEESLADLWVIARYRFLASYAKREDDQTSRLSCPSFPKWSADDAPGNFSRGKHSTTLPVNTEQPSGFEERQVCPIHRWHQHRPVQVLVAAFARGLR